MVGQNAELFYVEQGMLKLGTRTLSTLNCAKHSLNKTIQYILVYRCICSNRDRFGFLAEILFIVWVIVG